jgi:hypothetical protein
MIAGDLQTVSHLHWSAANLLASMPLPEGCGGMLFQVFRGFLSVVLTASLTGGLVAMLWKIAPGRWRAPARGGSKPSPTHAAVLLRKPLGWRFATG